MISLKAGEQQITELVSVNGELTNCLNKSDLAKSSLARESDRLVIRYKDKLLRLQETISQLTCERDRLRTNLESSESNLKTLTEEHEKLRNGLKQVKYRQPEQDDEKTCKNCKKPFRDNENFNWSCKVHSSSFSGDIWWCCGKKGEIAPGCKVCMHKSKEERMQLLDGEVLMKKQVCSVINS